MAASRKTKNPACAQCLLPPLPKNNQPAWHGCKQGIKKFNLCAKFFIPPLVPPHKQNKTGSGNKTNSKKQSMSIRPTAETKNKQQPDSDKELTHCVAKWMK